MKRIAANDGSDGNNQCKKKKGDNRACAFHWTSEDANVEVNRLKHSDAVLKLNLPQASASTSPSSPFKVQVPPSKHQHPGIGTIPDITLPSSDQLSLLEKLLYPLSPSTFLTTCFRQKAVHVQSNNAQRVRKLNSKFMFDLDAKKIFEETSSDSIFLWIRDSNGNSKNNENTDSASSSNSESKRGKEKLLKSIEVQDPEMAHILHTASNYASYCRAPPDLEQPLVYNLLKDTGMGCGQYTFDQDSSVAMAVPPPATRGMGRGEVETFIGTEGHVTDWHIDFQENFTIQLSGSKKWYLKQSPMKHPLRGVTPHYSNTEDVIENQLKASKLSSSAPNFGYDFEENNLSGGASSNSFGNIDCVTLNQGDVLYFPAGMWHKVETLEYGVSINISLMGSNYASVVCDAMEHLLLKRDEWREVICNKNTTKCKSRTGGNGKVQDNANKSMHHESDIVVQKLESLLSELPGIISEFHRNGGANFILPPVLRHAPRYVLSSEDNENIDDNSFSDDNKLDCVKEVSKDMSDNDDDNVDDEDENKSDLDEDDGRIEHEEEDDDDDENDNVVDIELFECPEDRNYCRPSLSHKLVKNPLATIMKMTDVTSFYSNRKLSINHAKHKLDHLFILNVSYAGNEMHESCIRTIFLDRSEALESIWKIEQSGACDTKYQDAFSGKSPPDALFYFGYFNWVQY